MVISKTKNNSGKNLSLRLPKAKHFKATIVTNGEKKLQVQKLVNEAVTKDRCYNFHERPWVGIEENPVFYAVTYRTIINTEVPRTLQKIILNHPFPLSQGPVILPLDCSVDKEKKTENDVLASKTLFQHDTNQKCCEWHPRISGIYAWGNSEEEGGYEVKDLTYNIQGAASARNMEVLYTCQFQKCLIICPCSICKNKGENCRYKCKDFQCNDCESQCTQHALKLPRLFNLKEDQFTIITDKIEEYRFAVPHAGIPSSCEFCSKDVLEHQALHLVFHGRCKFCLNEMRYLEYKKIVITLEDYRLVTKFLRQKDKTTCSHCFIKNQDIYARKKHEETVHEKRVKKHNCDKCEASYSNRNAMSLNL